MNINVFPVLIGGSYIITRHTDEVAFVEQRTRIEKSGMLEGEGLVYFIDDKTKDDFYALDQNLKLARLDLIRYKDNINLEKKVFINYKI